MKTPILVTALALGLPLAAPGFISLVDIFTPDFSTAFTGGGPNQFTAVYQAENGQYSTVSVVGNRFQFASQHDANLTTGPALAGWNQSAVQLSRNRNSAPLPFNDKVGAISLHWRWQENVWGAADNNIFNMQIGGNFRTGAFNPSGGGGNGPAFASLTLQGRSTEGQFRFIAGGGPGSANFDLTKVDGFYAANIFALFNNSGTAQTVQSPTGSYTLNNASLAVWINSILVWDNYTHGTNININAEFENISFGFGNGTNRTFEEAEPFGGIMQISDLTVSTIPEPSTYAALLGIVVLGLVVIRRRRQR